VAIGHVGPLTLTNCGRRPDSSNPDRTYAWYISLGAGVCCSNGVSACDAAPTPCENDADFQHGTAMLVRCSSESFASESGSAACEAADGAQVERDGALACLMTPAACQSAGGTEASIEETCGMRFTAHWTDLVRAGASCTKTGLDPSTCAADTFGVNQSGRRLFAQNLRRLDGHAARNNTNTNATTNNNNNNNNNNSGPSDGGSNRSPVQNCAQAAERNWCIQPDAGAHCATTCQAGGCNPRTAQERAEAFVAAGCCGSGQAKCANGGSIAAVGPTMADGTSPAVTAVTTHTVEGSLTLNMAAVGDLGSAASLEAMKAAIAEQAGVNLADVASVEISMKVTGTMPMQVSNPAVFAASTEAKEGIQRAIAAQNSVPASDVTATLSSVARRLSKGRQLQSNVNVAFEVAVTDGAAADAMTQTMSTANTADLAAAVNTELVSNTDLQVTSVASVTASPEVSVSYTIVTTDESVATAAQAEILAITPAAMTASVNAQLETAGVAAEVTVTSISAPTTTTAVTFVDPATTGLAGGDADMADKRGPGFELKMIALFAAATICADH